MTWHDTNMDACLLAVLARGITIAGQTVLHAESAAAAAAEATDAVPSLVLAYQGILLDYTRKWRCSR
jgi:hypothetical protein